MEPAALKDMEDQNGKKYFIWGTGALARQFSHFYKEDLDKINFHGYIDNNPEKWDTDFFGKKIHSPDVLKLDGEKNILILTKYRDEIKKQIQEKYSPYSCSIISECFMDSLRQCSECADSGDSDLYTDGMEEDSVIYGFLSGGLGNQLFIYAFCRQLVEKLNKRAILCFDGLDGDPLNQLRITAFPLDRRITIIPWYFPNAMKDVGMYDKFSFCCGLINRLPSQRLKTAVGYYFHRAGIVYIEEGYGKINYAALKKKKRVVFKGYMQSERFFSQVSDSIQREFSTLRQTKTDAESRRREAMIQNIRSEVSVCIHIRRGDYLSDQYKDLFLVCTDDYYRRAVARMRERVPEAVYYVFSDSIDLVKENMEYIRELDPVYVENSGEQAALDDFLMMKACRHFIISNSSFSWWAQYLGSAQDKIVIAPSRWLNYGYGNKDIYQDNWELIDP